VAPRASARWCAPWCAPVASSPTKPRARRRAVGRRHAHRHARAVGERLDLHAQPALALEHRGVRRRHAPDGAHRAAGAAHGEARAARHGVLPRGAAQRDLVHVHEMRAQPLEIDAGPVGGRVGLEQPHHLGDRRVGRLAALRGAPAAGRAGGVLHARGVRVRLGAGRRGEQEERRRGGGEERRAGA
jgi:hypothetical protein